MVKHHERTADVTCRGAKGNGVCVARQGRVLSIEEWVNPASIPDREFCQHKKGTKCVFNLKGGH